VAALIAANDKEVSAALDKAPSGGGFRGLGAQAMTTAAAYTTAGSQLYHDARLVPVIDRLVSSLLRSQRANGLFDPSSSRRWPGRNFSSSATTSPRRRRSARS
jgi:hypothetical protein